MGPRADSQHTRSGGRDSGFMETWLVRSRIWTSPVTYFMQYLLLLLVCVLNHTVLFGFVTQQALGAKPVDSAEGPLVLLCPSRTLWGGVDCGFVLARPPEVASRWPRAFNCLSDVGKIKFRNKRSTFYWAGLSLSPNAKGEVKREP